MQAGWEALTFVLCVPLIAMSYQPLVDPTSTLINCFFVTSSLVLRYAEVYFQFTFKCVRGGSSVLQLITFGAVLLTFTDQIWALRVAVIIVAFLYYWHVFSCPLEQEPQKL